MGCLREFEDSCFGKRGGVITHVRCDQLWLTNWGYVWTIALRILVALFVGYRVELTAWFMIVFIIYFSWWHQLWIFWGLSHEVLDSLSIIWSVLYYLIDLYGEISRDTLSTFMILSYGCDLCHGDALGQLSNPPRVLVAPYEMITVLKGDTLKWCRCRAVGELLPIVTVDSKFSILL